MKKANLIFSHFSMMKTTRMGCFMRAVRLSRLPVRGRVGRGDSGGRM